MGASSSGRVVAPTCAWHLRFGSKGGAGFGQPVDAVACASDRTFGKSRVAQGERSQVLRTGLRARCGGVPRSCLHRIGNRGRRVRSASIQFVGQLGCIEVRNGWWRGPRSRSHTDENTSAVAATRRESASARLPSVARWHQPQDERPRRLRPPREGDRVSNAASPDYSRFCRQKEPPVL